MRPAEQDIPAARQDETKGDTTLKRQGPLTISYNKIEWFPEQGRQEPGLKTRQNRATPVKPPKAKQWPTLESLLYKSESETPPCHRQKHV
jgi:hypothetical protein